jgi:hypothetical protein
VAPKKNVAGTMETISEFPVGPIAEGGASALAFGAFDSEVPIAWVGFDSSQPDLPSPWEWQRAAMRGNFDDGFEHPYVDFILRGHTGSSCLAGRRKSLASEGDPLNLQHTPDRVLSVVV